MRYAFTLTNSFVYLQCHMLGDFKNSFVYGEQKC